MIKHIDIICHSHTDYGFTDHPVVTRELHRRYVYEALSSIDATRAYPEAARFRWTIEVLDSFRDFWEQAAQSDRDRFLTAYDEGSIDIGGFPFHNTPFMDALEWEAAFSWIPEDLYTRLGLSSAMQTDVNGVPRAGAVRAVKRGIRYLWTGPNSYFGGPPFPAPRAFLWELPESEPIFVWLNAGYCNAFYLMNENFRLGPIPAYSDLSYRCPRRGDFFKTDRNSLSSAHNRLAENLAVLEAVPGDEGARAQAMGGANAHGPASSGYTHERLIVSLTNQWRLDNDPPFAPAADFVAAWNEKGYEPELRLSTLTQAMTEMEFSFSGTGKSRLGTYAGDWTDFWANGSVSAPLEMAVSRKAKRTLSVAKVLPPAEENSTSFADGEGREESILRSLCMFDEHSWGSYRCVAYPLRLESEGQFFEKAAHAYRALASSELLLADRVRASFPAERGIYLFNPSELPVSETVSLPYEALRGECRGLSCGGTVLPIERVPGENNFVEPGSPDDFSDENLSRTFIDRGEGRTARFHAELSPRETKRFLPVSADELGKTPPHSDKASSPFTVAEDARGFPSSVSLAEGDLSIFDGPIAEFESYTSTVFNPRWEIRRAFMTPDEAERKRKRDAVISRVPGVFERAVKKRTEQGIVYEQRFSHPSLVWGKRSLILFSAFARLRVNVRIMRKEIFDPEVYFLSFRIGEAPEAPLTSNGGVVFRPGIDQIPGTCMDYHAIDNWIACGIGSRALIVSSSDAPLVSFGGPAVALRRRSIEDFSVLSYLVFDSTWDTNFPCDRHGVWEFEFDVALSERGLDEAGMKKIGENLPLRPILMANT